MNVTEEIALSLGFTKIPHFTVMNSMIMDIGRNRHLSLGDINTCNTMLFICNTDYKKKKKITDVVCLHNYDYDKHLTVERLENIIKIFKQE
mgnify:CR=1 FL=1